MRNAKYFNIFFSVLVLIVMNSVLAACTFPTSGMPTATLPASDLPSETPDAAPSTEPPPPAESPTPEDKTEVRSQETIQVAAPGPNSRVVSPLVVEGIADSSFGGTLTVQLFEFDESGMPVTEKLLAETAVQVQPQMGSNGPFQAELAFSPSKPGAIGWLLVTFIDPEDGGLVHAANVQLTLLVEGPPEINPPATSEETIEIQMPEAGTVVSGGELTVSGYSEYFFESNLGVALCWTGPDTGNADDHLFCGSPEHLIAQSHAMIAAPDMGFPGPFEGTITYAVAEETPARLVVYATSPRDGSLLHLSSVEVVLQP
ncbi:MAG: Gmad2 immunoglobulin-like domain-containing protein [Anaerolineales bacterium]|jgi:hypothetical protein